MKLFSFLKPASHIEKLPAKQVDTEYKKYRMRNFIGIFVGYACYYLLRKNFSLAMPYLQNDGFTKIELSWILASLPIAYGISKFIMGNLSDRSNPRYFIVVGLSISIFANLIFGFFPSVATSFLLMCLLMLINGWAQGMGAPPCYRTAAHWFSISERGRIMSFWNISHNLGAALLGGLATIIIPIFTWKSVFFIPSIIVAFLAILIIILMRDTPQSVGLMPIEEYKNDFPPKNDAKDVENQEQELTTKEILFKYVLVNKYIWFLALANVFVYFVRSGISDWAPIYLTEVKGLNLSLSGTAFIVYEMAGILGMLMCGYISDKIFKGKRAPVSILCMIIVSIGVLLYWLSPSMVITQFALFLIGMFVYGPVMLVGIQVLDIMPKKAVGTAIGLLGLFGYWGGSMAASVGIGYIVDLFGWSAGLFTLALACGFAAFFFSLTLGIQSVKKQALEIDVVAEDEDEDLDIAQPALEGEA